MAREVVLVNGLPGAGKSTLAAALADELGVLFLAKDRVKEALATAVDHDSVQSKHLGVIAMETVWAIAATVPGPVVVDSWWFRPRDLEHARAGLAKAGAQVTIEVWCDVPVGVARERYAQRHRHAIHHDTRDMTDEWARWTADGQPLALGPVLRVDTTAPVDTPRLAKAVVEQLGAVTPTP